MFHRSLRKLLDRPQVTIKDFCKVPSESDSNSRDSILHKGKDQAYCKSGVMPPDYHHILVLRNPASCDSLTRWHVLDTEYELLTIASIKG
jgi:hypothetical protein